METFSTLILVYLAIICIDTFGVPWGLFAIFFGIFLQVRMSQRDAIQKEILDILKQIRR
jgi:hypothetical protein